MKSRVDKIAGAALLLALLGAAPFHSGAQQKHTKGRALLVGVNQYQQPWVNPVRGSEEDALATREFIKRQYGFLDGEIRLLVGPQATRRAILDSFKEWLVEGTQPGERVFFLFSGHGSRLKDDDGDERLANPDDSMDETIVPFDVDERPASQIRDDEINQLVAALAGRMVVMVFDSCHSGTISRALGQGSAMTDGVKYLPPLSDLAELKIARSRGGGDAPGYAVEGDRQARDLKLTSVPVDRQSLPTAGLIVVSAAKSGQLARWIQTGSGYRGALSFIFVETQREKLLTLRRLEGEVRKRMGDLYVQRKVPAPQDPVFEVFGPEALYDEPLFASNQADLLGVMANPNSAIQIGLRTPDGKTQYRIGEKVSYEVTTDRAGYLYLLVFSEGDTAGCIFPNNKAPENQDNRVTAGRHRIPRAGSFYAQVPVGKDVVIALLSNQELNLVYGEDYTWGQIFERLKSKKFFDHVTTRGQTAKKPSPGAPAVTLDQVEWQAASLVLYTVR
jgi:hypothetical protein